MVADQDVDGRLCDWMGVARTAGLFRKARIGLW